jgi:hypothetical protein
MTENPNKLHDKVAKRAEDVAMTVGLVSAILIMTPSYPISGFSGQTIGLSGS